MKAFLAGIVLALVFILLVHSVLPQPDRQLIALFLAFTACTYAGALLAQRVPAHFGVLELVVAGVVFELAVVGLRASTAPLAAGYALHGAWDLLHHPRAIPTRVAPWFPPACAAFDFVVALALLIGPLAADGLAAGTCVIDVVPSEPGQHRAPAVLSHYGRRQ